MSQPRDCTNVPSPLYTGEEGERRRRVSAAGSARPTLSGAGCRAGTARRCRHAASRVGGVCSSTVLRLAERGAGEYAHPTGQSAKT